MSLLGKILKCFGRPFARRAPLRTVVHSKPGGFLITDKDDYPMKILILSCGHRVRIQEEGYTYRFRCKECLEEIEKKKNEQQTP